MDKRTLIITLGALLAFGALARLMPHLPNATPITALAIVSALYIGRRWSLALPLLAVFLSDFFIGFYDWRIMASVYGSFAMIGLLSWITKKYRTPFAILGTIVGSSLLFFLITNFAVWLFSPWYAKDLAGLLYSYELGLPFLRNMLAGDLFYTFSLIGIFEFARNGFFIKRLTAKRTTPSCTPVSKLESL